MIIGPDSKGNFDPTLGGLYSNANASIRGNNGNPAGDNPSILGSATFILTIPGLTTDSVLSNVRILFGTGTDFANVSCDNCGNPPGDVPVPGAAWLMGTVLGGAGFTAWRRRRRVKAA